MAPKRFFQKDTTWSSIGKAIESNPVNFLIFSNTQLFIEKELDITWQKVNEVLSLKSFKIDLEDRQVYVDVQRSGLHKIACRYPIFPCADIVSSIFSWTNNKTMTLNNSSGHRLASFMAHDF